MLAVLELAYEGAHPAFNPHWASHLERVLRVYALEETRAPVRFRTLRLLLKLVQTCRGVCEAELAAVVVRSRVCELVMDAEWEVASRAIRAITAICTEYSAGITNSQLIRMMSFMHIAASGRERSPEVKELAVRSIGRIFTSTCGRRPLCA